MKNLLFVIGVPGSRWSGFHNMLIHLSPPDTFDISDRQSDRFYQHMRPGTNKIWLGINHQGAYFGPGFGLGERWHEKEYITRENLLNDISAVWDLSSPGIKIIKSHVLALNLDKLRQEFPDSRFIFVTLPKEICYRGWLRVGGFEKISYPNYSPYYKNKDVMLEKLTEEHNCTSSYIINNKLSTIAYSENFWKDNFDLTIDRSQEIVNNLDEHLMILGDIGISIAIEK